MKKAHVYLIIIVLMGTVAACSPSQESMDAIETNVSVGVWKNCGVLGVLPKERLDFNLTSPNQCGFSRHNPRVRCPLD